jgi:hypothetical protein
VRVIGGAIVRAHTPYPDRARRRKVGKAARNLHDPRPWQGDDATPLDVASVALRRLLWLQSEARRSAYLRQTEATALLARTSIETCIVGMYCLHGDDPVDRLRAGNVRLTERLFEFLVDIDLMPKDVLGVIGEVMGDSKQPINVKDMVESIKVEPGRSFARSLYFRYYGPLSSLFAHSGGLALLRQVRGGDVAETPGRAWNRRAAIRLVDASVGALAAEIAIAKKAPSDLFAEYCDAHLRRAFIPLLTFARTSAAETKIQWRLLTRLAVRVIRLARSGVPEGADEAQVRALIEPVVKDWSDFAGSDFTLAARERAVRQMTDALVVAWREGRDAPSTP